MAKGFGFSLKSVAKKLYKTKKLISTLHKTKWEDLNEEAQKVFKRANDRFNNLRNEGYYTAAMDQAIKDTGHQGFGYFNKKKPTKFELLKEMYAARTFINDYTSTMEGAELESRKMTSAQYEEAFGKQWYATYGVSYDTSRIDPEKAKVAFAIFREVEHHAAAFLYSGKGFYDSDNLIRDIYDIVDDNYDGHPLLDRDRSELITLGVEKAREIIEQQRRLEHPEENIKYIQDFIDVNAIIGRFRR